VGSAEGFPVVLRTMWVSRERFPADFRREEKDKTDFREEKEKREGKVFKRARVMKCQVLTYKHNNIDFLRITDVNIISLTSVLEKPMLTSTTLHRFLKN